MNQKNRQEQNEKESMNMVACVTKNEKSKFIDTSPYKGEHDKIVDYIREQLGINLNKYRDGNGTNPFTTSYWDCKGYKVCINWTGSTGGMDKNTQSKIETFVKKSHGKLELEWGGAWFKYISFAREAESFFP